MEGNKPAEKEEKDEKKEVKTVYVSKTEKNPWMLYTAVLAVVVVVLAFFLYSGKGGITGDVIDKDKAAEKLVDYLNSRTGGGVELVSSEEDGSLYKVMVSYQGDEIPVYVTKDGEYFVQGVVPITSSEGTPATNSTEEIPKTEKPKVELFVMTHCPYGTQAEKGIIPVLELLGDKIDAKIKFVHYFMHEPEEEETPRQLCIREEQPDKWLLYLKCFLEDGDADRCINEAGISESKLKSCMVGKSEDYYAEDSADSQSAGVSGSPTLIINGNIVSSARSPAAYLQTICSAFNEAPEECSEELSSANPSPGFGYGESESSSGSC